ncbi:MAG: hypothetical protein U0798_17225 [Gemmataceae bacterium]
MLKTESVKIIFKPAGLGLFQLGLEVGHVVMLVTKALSLAEPHAIDDAGVIQFIRKNGVLFGEKRFEQAAVGIEAGNVQDGIGLAEERGDGPLGLLVDPLRSADKANG